MTKDKLNKLEKDAHKLFLDTLHNLRNDYAKNNAIYKVGDFIRSITGIIQVNDIIYKTQLDELGTHIDTYIAYCGYKYECKDNILYIKPKQKKTVCFVDYGDNLELFENPNPF